MAKAKIAKDVYLPETQNADASRTVLIITGDKTEDLEFFYPYYRFIEAGYKVDVATPKGGKFKGKHGLGLKETKKIAAIDPRCYQLLYLPGGNAPQKLKRDPGVIETVRYFVQAGKPIAAICHGPQILAAADVIRNRQIAAWPEVADEVKDAGASYVNEETVVDGLFITGRWSGDLPAHMRRTLESLDHAKMIRRPRVAA